MPRGTATRMRFRALWESDHEGLVAIRFRAEHTCGRTAEQTRVAPGSGRPQVLRRAVSRTHASVTRTEVTPIRTTASSANPGSPTSPGPWPELRGSPPAPGLGGGDAASVTEVDQSKTARTTEDVATNRASAVRCRP